MHRALQLLAVVLIVYYSDVAAAQSVSGAATCWFETNRSSNTSDVSRQDVCDLERTQCGRTSLTKRVSPRCSEVQCDITRVDASLLPDFWNAHGAIDPRIATNGAEPPEQLVKVTDRRHRHPVFATVCSIAFLLTIVTIIIVCTH